MAIVRPTLSELVENIRSDADALLGGVDARLERSLVDVLLVAQAGALHGAYGRIQRIADDAFADTATSDALARLAGQFGISRGAATFAQGWVGSTDLGFVFIAVGTRFRRADGAEFETTNSGFLADGTEVQSGAFPVAFSALGLVGSGYALPVRAVTSGTGSNTAAATSVSFVSPVANQPPVLSVQLAIAGAVDSEQDEALRTRLLARYQAPPQGGTAADYKAWTLGAATAADPISRAFVVPPASGDNLVTVYIADDGGGLPAANPPTPTAQAITNATAAINARRPLSSRITVAAPTFVAAALTISLSPNTSAIQAAIEKEIDAFLIDNAAPGLELPVALLQAAVATAAGGGDAQITSPTANWTPTASQLLIRGAITWV